MTCPVVDSVRVPSTRMLSASTMTAQRQERNGWRPGMVFIALLSGFAAMAALAIAARAATTERGVADRYTRLALGGVDPLAYFTEARPLAGSRRLRGEVGASWRRMRGTLRESSKWRVPLTPTLSPQAGRGSLLPPDRPRR